MRRNSPTRRGELLEPRRLLSVDHGQGFDHDHSDPGHICDVNWEWQLSQLPFMADDDQVSQNPAGESMPTAPALNSRPGAFAKLFLDFDGDFTASWGSSSPGTTPPYSIDGDTANFSPQELANIEEIWGRVAEKYSPFNINVTTVDPGNLNNFETMRIVIGGTGAWYGGGAGGVAFIDGFTSSASNTAWVFSAQSPTNLGFVAEATAHEAGHGFGLLHQSTYNQFGQKTAEYNPGANGVAPIMGVSYNAQRGLWWSGPSSTGATFIQNDLSIISKPANQFGYRPDDRGGTIATATPLTGANGSFTGGGVIENVSDVDMYSFTLTSPGPTNIQSRIAQAGGKFIGMLDSTLRVYNSAGSEIGVANTTGTNESITLNLTPGTYYAAVSSRGGYGDVGQYTVVTSQTVDLTSPTVSSAIFELALQQTVTVVFSEDVSPSLVAGDMTLNNLTTGQTFNPDSLLYNAATNAATFGFANDILPDGNYRATLLPADVSDPFGNPLAAPLQFDFYVLAADADRNRTVNVGDFARLASNFNLIDRVFQQGDFNYDRTTNIADFAILAAKFNTGLPAPRPAPAGSAAPAAAPEPTPPGLFATRPIEDIESL